MRKIIVSLVVMVLGMATSMVAAEPTIIRVSTQQTDLVLRVNPKGRLCQTYFGAKLRHDADLGLLPCDVYAGSDGSTPQHGLETYVASGAEDFYEPAVAITHADGNQSTYLYYKGHEQQPVAGGTETIIRLADDRYADEVTLHYVAYDRENVIKAWSEIRHHEKRPVRLWRYGSTMLYLEASRYYLTSYHSDWAREGQPETQLLTAGKKIIDTKLGTRAAMHEEPFFELGLDAPASEQGGRVLLGTIGWTGNFRFTFEVDHTGVLRLVPAINPYASSYELRPGETFTTPEFIFTLSDQGTGQASRNLHDWARRHQLNDGMGPRLTLLNNWESTGFDFDQQSLARLMREARDLGVDMFLLDDGWFANKYPRRDDHAGLGDWEPTRAKLPEGIDGLTRAASEAGVKFGLWIEPEMVNPQSELFERHPDWAITLPGRDTYYYRNQLVLDLCNPEVQDYVYGVVDRLVTQHPGIAYFKWDCNSPITNIHSHYLGQKQGRLYIDYVRGLYNVLRRLHARHPQLPMMLCSGGGARCDYEALRYFTEFWPSDNTDPYERLHIQWSMSRFFPVKALASHVTNWNRRAPLKFRVDVASMCKLGFDIRLSDLSTEELQFAREAVKNYDRLRPVILDGTLYRLVSPYETAHCAVNYVSADLSRAVVMAYDLHPRFREPVQRVRLQGLDPDRRYTVHETNLMPGQTSRLSCDGQTLTGDYLMRVGLDLLSADDTTSHVVELTAE